MWSAGMEVYPAAPSLLTFVTQPLMAGVIAGVCFLFVAIILSLVTACGVKHRRDERRKKQQDGKGNKRRIVYLSHIYYIIHILYELYSHFPTFLSF